MSWGAAIAGGLLGGSVVVGVMALRKKRELTLRAAQIQKTLEGRGDAVSLYLATKGAGASLELEQLARETAELVATERLATRWYLGPEQMRQLALLGRQLES